MTSEDRLYRIERRLARLEALLGDPRVVRALLGLIADDADDAPAQSAFMSPAFRAEAEANKVGQRDAAKARNERYLEALAGLRAEGWVTEDASRASDVVAGVMPNSARRCEKRAIYFAVDFDRISQSGRIMAKQKRVRCPDQSRASLQGSQFYIVCADSALGIAGLKAHITIEKITTKGKKYVVTKFHVTFVGTKPQAGATWEWSSSSYAFKAWYEAKSLAGKILAGKEAQFLTAVNTYVNLFETKFADSAGSIAAPTAPTIR
jgi:hypothetical protein